MTLSHNKKLNDRSSEFRDRLIIIGHGEHKSANIGTITRL
jgi:hypothetical protein